MAAKIVLEPIFEADFQPCSYGFRPRQSATQALEAIRITGGQGHYHVVDADIQGFFDAIDQDLLLEKLAARISDRRVLKLLRRPGGQPFRASDWPHRRLVQEHTVSINCWALFATLEARMPHDQTIGKPDAGNPHVRF